jgi:RNA polymerase sigma factor (TIGR02999 family)
MNEITHVLQSIERGEAQAADLLPLVYEELRKLAASRMANEQAGQTLQPTALVHEAWLRLVDTDGQGQFNGRAHFFGAAAEAMRRILIDRARRKHAQRHGGGQQRLDIADMEIAAEAQGDELLALDEALAKLAAAHPPKAELVKLRYFVGLSIAEAAAILGISEPTAKRHWSYARAWLQAELSIMRNADKGGGVSNGPTSPG